MQRSKEIQTDRCITKRQLLITPALPTAGQKLQNYFEGHTVFCLKICCLFIS
jgi:hypothetical protein